MKTLKNITIGLLLFTIPLLVSYLILLVFKGRDYNSRLLDTVAIVWLVCVLLDLVAWILAYRKDILNDYRNFIHSDNVKIELVKYTSDITGDVVYYVKANGKMQDGTWTKDENLAKEHLKKVTEKAKEHPKAIYETIETVNI